MKRVAFLFFLFTLSVFAQGGTPPGGYSPSSGGSTTPASTNGLAPNNAFSLSPNCSSTSISPCQFVYADARITADCGTTNTQPTITSATAAFTSADIGKFAWCVNNSTGALAIKGTVLSVQSATQITVSNNATQTTTGLNFAIGHDDGTAINAASAAAVLPTSGITGLNLPCAMMVIDSGQPLFSKSTAILQNGSVSGCGGAAGELTTALIMGPDFFPTTGCTGSGTYCIWAIQESGALPGFDVGTSEMPSNLKVTGLGYHNPMSSGNAILFIANQADNIEVENIDFPSVTCQIIEGGLEAHLNRMNIQHTDCSSVNMLGGQGDNVLSNSVIALNGGAQNTSYAGQCGSNGAGLCTFVDDYFISNTMPNNHAVIANLNGSTLNVISGYYQITGSASNFDAGTGILNLAEATILANSASVANIISEGATIGVHQSVIKNTASGGRLLNVTGTGLMDDVDGNTILGIGTTATAFPIEADGHLLNGTCTGSASASSTLGLYGTGPNETVTTCTSTTIGSGTVIQSSRTLQNFTCNAGVAGTTTTTCTVLVNGSASALTCNLVAASTQCNDITDTVAVTQGALVSIEIITGAATTPSGINAYVHWN